MPDYLPERPSDGRVISPVQRAQIARHQRRAEMEVVRHGVDAWKRREKYELDIYASTDAARTALDEELNFYDYGSARINGSEVGRELMARKLNILSSLHDTRLLREFR